MPNLWNEFWDRSREVSLWAATALLDLPLENSRQLGFFLPAGKLHSDITPGLVPELLSGGQILEVLLLWQEGAPDPRVSRPYFLILVSHTSQLLRVSTRNVPATHVARFLPCWVRGPERGLQVGLVVRPCLILGILQRLPVSWRQKGQWGHELQGLSQPHRPAPWSPPCPCSRRTAAALPLSVFVRAVPSLCRFLFCASTWLVPASSPPLGLCSQVTF